MPNLIIQDGSTLMKKENSPDKFSRKWENSERSNVKKTDYVVTNADKLLAVGALIVGITYALFSRISAYGEVTQVEFSMYYAVFWVIFAAVMLSYAFKRIKWVGEIWLILGAVSLLFLREFIYDNSGVNSTLSIINLFVAIPLLLMAVPTILTYGLCENSVFFFIRNYLRTAFCSIFKYSGRFFAAISSAFKGRYCRKTHLVLTGIAIGLPIFIVLMLILARADGAMSFYVGKIFSFDFQKILDFISFILRTTIMTLIAYSLVYSIEHRANEHDRPEHVAIRINSITIGIIIGMMLLAYAIFTYFQFAYLTGLNGLPEALTYSEYAIRGFSELILVSFINISALSIALSFCKDEDGKLKDALRRLLMGLLTATIIILASAMLRLGMYIASYGYTLRRVLALWLEVAILIIIIIGTVKLYIPKFRAVYWSAAAITAWYAILNLLDIQRIFNL